MKYKIVDLDDTYNLKNFKCENTSINNYLYHDSYYKHILKLNRINPKVKKLKAAKILIVLW